jgi:hypothetical protein
MARTRKQDEQAREPWRINGKTRPEAQTRAFASPIQTTPTPARQAPGPMLIDPSAVADATYNGSTQGAPIADGQVYLAAAVDPYASADPSTVSYPYADPYQSPYGYPDPNYDDTVLGGLSYRTAAPRQPVGDSRWAASLRSFARATVWCLPAAVVALALSTVWGWPTTTTEPNGASPGTWLVVTLAGLGLWLTGVTGLAALVASTPVRAWGFVAVTFSIAGTVLLAPVIGVLGLARPAVSRTADAIGADAAGRMQAQLLDGTVGRWLIVGGAALLAVGAIAVAGAILGARALNRLDGWLVAAAITVAVVAAYLSWEFLLTLAAMVMLAATLGLAWTVSRISPDGEAPPAY